MTESAAVDMMRPFFRAEVANVHPVRNGEVLHFAGLVVGYEPDGVFQPLNLLISLEHGRWVVVDAGPYPLTAE